MKTCYVIVAHAPSCGKEELLINLLSKLKQNDEKTLLILHSKPSDSALDLADYIVYDKNNELYMGYPTQTNHFDPLLVEKIHFDAGKCIETKYASHIVYHGISAMALVFQGLHIAKLLGYDLCHVIEYDTDLGSLDEFKENERLLNNSTFSSVFYHLGPHDHMVYCQISSYNLNRYTFADFDWGTIKTKIKEIVTSDYYNINNGMVEIAFYELLHKNKLGFKKYACNLINNFVDLDLSNRNKVDNTDLVYIAPYMQNQSEVGVVALYSKSVTNQPKELRVVANGIEKITHLSNQGDWWYSTVGGLERLEYIEFYIDGKLQKKYDFVNEIIKEHFKNNSNIK